MQRAERVFPNPRLLILPHCGHLAPLESPEAFNAAAVEFLREVAGAGADRGRAAARETVAGR